MFLCQAIVLLSFLGNILGDAVDEKSCYRSDGEKVTDEMYMPCISIKGIDSMCCAINRTDIEVDTCLPNGLCQSGGYPWMNFCTDPKWESPNCIPKDMCSGTASHRMIDCGDGSYCCGGTNVSCCTQKLGFKLKPTLVALGGPTSTTTVNETISSTRGGGLSPSLQGVAIGVPLAFLAVLGIGLGFWLGKRIEKKKLGLNVAGGNDHTNGAANDKKMPMLSHVDQSGLHEVQAFSRPAELRGSDRNW